MRSRLPVVSPARATGLAFAFVLGAVCSAPGSAQGTSEALAPETRDLFRVIAERLALMHSVARIKLAEDRPVSDREREAVVLERAVADARAAGLDAETTRAFFRAQIAAAKAIQYRALAEWQTRRADLPFPDAGLDAVRPRLLELGAAIVRRLAMHLGTVGPVPAGARGAFDAALAGLDLSAGDRRRLFRALRAVRAGPLPPDGLSPEGSARRP